MAPELTTKANDLIAALGRLAAAQEGTVNPQDVEALFATAAEARNELAGLLGQQ